MDNISLEDRRRMGKNAENIVATITAGYLLATTTAAVGWATEKAFKNSFSDDPSKSVTNFIKWTANVSICQLALFYAVK